MKNSSFIRIIFQFLFILTPFLLLGQIDYAKVENKFGEGETTLKKTIKISFFYSAEENKYFAKVSYKYNKLNVFSNPSGLVQIPFNEFQKVNLKKAKYYRIDSLNKKILIENVKIKYADTKDYFIENIFYADLKVKQFRSSVTLPEKYILTYSYDVIYTDLNS